MPANLKKLESLTTMAERRETKVTGVEKALDNFLAHQQKRVFAILGDWGVGKTHLWRDYIGRRLSKVGTPIPHPRYAYASLFGVSTVSELEQLLVAQSQTTGSDPVAKGADLGVRITEWLETIKPVKDYIGPLQKLVGLLITDSLICLDDLERRDNTLSMDLVLGFANALREEHGCKVVIIFNLSAMSNEDKDSLAKYREKIFDGSLLFDPDVESNLGLVIRDPDLYGATLPVFRELGVNSIRVMQLFSWVAEDLQNCLQGHFEKDIVSLVLLHAAAIACVYYCPDKCGEVEFEKWLTDKSLGGVFSDHEVKRKDSYTLLTARMSAAGFYGLGFDEYIKDLIVTGIFDRDQFLADLRSYSKDRAARASDDAYVNLWEGYSDGFVLTAKALTPEFIRFLEEHRKTLRLKYMHDAVQFLLDSEAITISKAKKLYSPYIELRLEGYDDETLRSIRIDWLYQRTRRLIDKEREKQTADFSLEGIVRRYFDTHSISREEKQALGQFSKDEVLEWLRECRIPGLLSNLNMHLASANGTDELSVFADNVALAIEELEKESALNRVRVRGLIPGALGRAREIHSRSAGAGGPA